MEVMAYESDHSCRSNRELKVLLTIAVLTEIPCTLFGTLALKGKLVLAGNALATIFTRVTLARVRS